LNQTIFSKKKILIISAIVQKLDRSAVRQLILLEQGVVKVINLIFDFY